MGSALIGQFMASGMPHVSKYKADLFEIAYYDSKQKVLRMMGIDNATVRMGSQMSVQGIRDSIDKVLEQRKQMLPRIEQYEYGLEARRNVIQRARTSVSHLLDLEHAQERKDKLTEILDLLDLLYAEAASDLERISSLRARFSRETVCIGVSGMARVGKSTTLQKMSGLTDEQIPTGNRQNVTAVHSVIHNTSEGDPRAKITFLSESEFIDDYIGSLVNDINGVLSSTEQLESPRSISGLRDMSIPSTLGSKITSTAADSLKRLSDAQDCIDTYKRYLSSQAQYIVLKGDDLARFKQFVAYPEVDDTTANRAYLAVKDVELFCEFPSIPGVKLSLIDLPGFGEINEGVAKGHIAALDKNVDHVLDILKPQDTSGSLTQSDGHAFDLLCKVQQGISSRKELITVGINVFEDYAQNADKLKEDFSNRYNLAQNNPFNVEMYHANEQESVFGIFGRILSELAVNLPHMDQDLLNEAVRRSGSTERRNDLIAARDALSALASSVPLPERILNEEILTIGNAIIFACQRYENELSSLSGKGGDSRALFNEQVDKCASLVRSELERGLFLGEDEWRSRAAGQSDYYNFYREECRRIRREITARYEKLDGFYRENTDQFKQRAIDTVFSNAGNLYDALGVDSGGDIDSTIDSLCASLATVVRGTGILPALKLLKSVRFSFRHNVFLNIAPCLEELLNPYERKASYASSANEKAIELGGIGDPAEQVNKLHRYLTEIGNRANDNIGDALKKAEDRFTEYLSVCMSFFIDYLYRMDESAFRQVCLRKLLAEYPEAMVGKQVSFRQNDKKIEAYSEAIKFVQDLIANPMSSKSMAARVKPHRDSNSSRHARAREDGSGGSLSKSKTIQGTVTDTHPTAGVFVDIGRGRTGLISMSKLKQFLDIGYINDPANYFSIGEKIVVRIARIRDNGKICLNIVKRQI